MTVEPTDRRQDGPRWSAPAERVSIVICLCVVLVAVIAALVILGIHHDIDKAGLTAVFGTIAGGAGSAIVHKLSSRG